jgi:predicted Zn-dependent protease
MKFILLLVVCALISSNNLNAHKVRAVLYVTDSKIDFKLVRAIEERAKKYYNIRVTFMGKMNYPKKTPNGYLAESFTNKLNARRGGKEYAICITDKDIIRLRFWEIDWSFTVDTILGYTDIQNSTCIISYADLKDTNTFNRTVNVVMHEMGHMVGLDHCENDNCLMVPYDHLDNDTLCYWCQKRLQKIKQ